MLDEAITLGSGRVQIGDTFWQVETNQNLPAGTRVQVVAAEPMKPQLASVE